MGVSLELPAAGDAGPWSVGQQALCFPRGLLEGHRGPVAFSSGSWLGNCSPPERDRLSLLQEAVLDGDESSDQPLFQTWRRFSCGQGGIGSVGQANVGVMNK